VGDHTYVSTWGPHLCQHPAQRTVMHNAAYKYYIIAQAGGSDRLFPYIIEATHRHNQPAWASHCLGTVSYCIRGPCHRVLSGQPGPIFHPRAFLDIQRYCVRSDSHTTSDNPLSSLLPKPNKGQIFVNVSIRACPTGAVPFSRENWLLLSTRSLPSDNSLCRHSCQTESSYGE
jgi:hypothetical protein